MSNLPTSAAALEAAVSPNARPREYARHYIPASAEDLAEMMAMVGVQSLAGLYSHLAARDRFDGPLPLPAEKSYSETAERMASMAENNRPALSFIGDGLPDFSVHEIVDYVCGLRNLATAYTPYQPERSQGTLLSHWIYQCLLSQLTGFEAINSSLYDRATALFEAAGTCLRLAREADTVIVPAALYPGDLEVLRTLATDTPMQLMETPLDPRTGLIDREALAAAARPLGNRLAAIVFPQVNTLGLIEDVDALTDFCHELGVRAVAVIDPLLLAAGGLKPPSLFGREGADLIVGEAQHLAIGPNFGGPGLGLYGIRFNDQVRNDVRQTPGRFTGKAFDSVGRECRVMVLSTREQHIRKEKATSNICSNQAFLATLTGAALLARGEKGLAAMAASARHNAREAVRRLTARPGVSLAFPDTPAFNEVVLQLPDCPNDFLEAARQAGLHAGIRVTDRVPGHERLIKLSFSDRHGETELNRLVDFFDQRYGSGTGSGQILPALPERYLRVTPPGLPEHTVAEVRDYYRRLSSLNISPDDGCYPLGSCTMKYNPYLNEWAAGLPGFTNAHPQAPVEDVQGCLEVLHEIQEWIKAITGLAGVTTQPVAGAQGELVGIKMFQAYHRDRGENHRDILFIPKSAHGTNFATAVMAGFINRQDNGIHSGVVLLEAGPDGRIEMADFEAKLAEFAPRLAGVMITNPNTSGIFETDFHQVADRVHAAGGLVYMDGANMNAVAGWANLGALGVDAVHNNLHKTWTIPHGGGGPGDAIVAVSERLLDYLPGYQVERDANGIFHPIRPPRSIGSFHRHWGNFAHKIRALTYLYRLGAAGVPRVTGVATLAARYCFERLRQVYSSLPAGGAAMPRMHEFILTLAEDDFQRLEKAGLPRSSVIGRIGKLFLDFGFHAPTVAWPEPFGLMIEPTESYTKAELDRFVEAVLAIHRLIREDPWVLHHVPLFTPVERIDDVSANRNLCLSESLRELPPIHPNRLDPVELYRLPVEEIARRILVAAEKRRTGQAPSATQH